ncbi:MAG: V-type ATP synthase subunit E [Thaumarchaeota archaeon]|nr:V-type ATP synthase subunit E [Nitrososphaerota archaeon]
MSGIEYTVRKVSDEALSEMLRSISESKSAALEVVSRKMNEAQAEVVRIGEQQKRQSEALRRQITGTAEMTARNRTLEIIEDNLNAAFSQALQKLDSMTSDPGYEDLLKSMILEGIDEVGGSEFVVSSNARDQSLVQKVIVAISGQKQVKISPSSSPLTNTIGGVSIGSGDGYVTFDNTYEARLERLKPALRKQLAKLFAEGPSNP